LKILITAWALMILLGACGGPTEIAGISDEGGCGPFDVDFDFEELVQITRNDCPFELTFRFIVEQDGCKLTFQDAGPDGQDLHGVVNSQGFYGVEIEDNNGALYECQGDAVADFSRGSYLLNCEFNAAGFCRIEAFPI
jgi:hypothetical protein